MRVRAFDRVVRFASTPERVMIQLSLILFAVAAVAGHKPGRPFRLAADWVRVVVEWVTTKAP